MLPMIVGTVHNTVKLAEMDGKWQQKKNSGKLWEKEDLDPVAKQIMQYKEDLEKMREGKKLADISSKMKSGAALSSDEIEYLQKNNPEMYREYMEVKSEKEAYERQLKSCRTKEDVDKLRMTKMGSFAAEAKSVTNNPNIPKEKKLELMEKLLKKTMNVQKIHMDFVDSEKYHNLPTEDELVERAEDKVERKEKFTESIEEGVREDAELAKRVKENINADMGMEPSADNDSSPEINAVDEDVEELADISEQTGIDYETVKGYIFNYIMENRPSGYGMEYLKEDFAEEKQYKIKRGM